VSVLVFIGRCEDNWTTGDDEILFSACRHDETAAVPSVMLAATLAKVDHVGLRLQVEVSQFRHYLHPNYLHIYRGMLSSSSVFISKLLSCLYLSIRVSSESIVQYLKEMGITTYFRKLFTLIRIFLSLFIYNVITFAAMDLHRK
jgi:hypothetical protein